ncbi:MAG: hypothetical protein K2Q18_15610 [Bdellovibrionales bacterium]|nr:hypothetical protein [Bdellovibrionales bacterium]
MCSLIFGITHFHETSLDRFDEANILIHGIRKTWDSSFGAPISWIYSALCSLITPVLAMQTMHFLASILVLPQLIFMIGESIWKNKWISFTASIVALTAYVNFPLTPKTQLYAFLFHLIVFFGIYRKDMSKIRFAVFSLCLSLIPFLRQDGMIYYPLAFYFYCYNHKILWKRVLLLSTSLLVGITIFTITIGDPWSAQRSKPIYLEAFQWQHKEFVKPYINSNLGIRRSVEILFKDPKTLSEAIMNRPDLFKMHLTTNLLALPKGLWSTLQIHAIPFIKAQYVWICFLIIIALMPSEVISYEAMKFLILFFSVSIFKCFSTSLLSSPIERYLLDIFLILFLILPVVVFYVSKKFITKGYHNLAVLMLFLLFSSQVFYFDKNFSPKNDINTIVETINNLHLDKKTTRMLALPGPIAYFNPTGDNFNFIFDAHKIYNIADFVKDNNINLIVADDSLKKLSRYNGREKEMQAIWDKVPLFGFTKILIPNSVHSFLLVKTQNLKDFK